MKHRHLLPNEIDLLVDGEVGFGVAPLRAHLLECAECAEQVEEARFVADALEQLPRFSPPYAFADKVMAQVPVFVPWHVAARDAVTGWLPSSRPLRIAAGALAASAAGVASLGIVWVGTRGGMATVASGVAAGQLRTVVGDALHDLALTTLGAPALASLSQLGTSGLAIAGLGFVGAAAGTLLGVRRLAGAAQRGR